ncbi:YolD-like family protein [bacterium]|nr:YolD-like family protein [bacterium]
MPTSERAKQFMPFAALRGYYDLIKQCEKVKEPKKELLDKDAEEISNVLNTLQKGDLVEIKYYNTDAYEEITGMISEIDKNYEVLSIIKTKIKFCDIIKLQKVD